MFYTGFTLLITTIPSRISSPGWKASCNSIYTWPTTKHATSSSHIPHSTSQKLPSPSCGVSKSHSKAITITSTTNAPGLPHQIINPQMIITQHVTLSQISKMTTASGYLSWKTGQDITWGILILWQCEIVDASDGGRLWMICISHALPHLMQGSLINCFYIPPFLSSPWKWAPLLPLTCNQSYSRVCMSHQVPHWGYQIPRVE